MDHATPRRPFGLRDKVGYLFGDFGNDFTFILSTMILMKFYTDVVGISARAVGTIMMVARFVDAFTDVTMGRICDRSRVRPGGKFKPWILRMCVPVAGASFLMYVSGLDRLPYAARVLYLLVTYILWGSLFYTAINIPYGSMASAISPDPGDRQSLSTYRSIGATLAGSIIGAYTIQAITTTLLSFGVSTDQAPVVKAIIVIAIVVVQSPVFQEYIENRRNRKASAAKGVA